MTKSLEQIKNKIPELIENKAEEMVTPEMTENSEHDDWYKKIDVIILDTGKAVLRSHSLGSGKTFSKQNAGWFLGSYKFNEIVNLEFGAGKKINDEINYHLICGKFCEKENYKKDRQKKADDEMFYTEHFGLKKKEK